MSSPRQRSSRRHFLGAPIPAREITPESLYLRRRDLMAGGAAWALAAGATLATRRALGDGTAGLPPIKKGPFATGEPQTPLKDVTGYNNFYEFGTDKEEPASRAYTLRPRPWAVACEGEVGKPQILDVDALIKMFPLEERIYRLRCVEAWSMVIPWVGFPLASLIKRLEPTSKAKYVAFTTLLAPDQMPGQRRQVLEWPYVEGLRMDEAMHPLAILAVGLYGKPLPNQNGAPIRLVVPWKYGFKSIKSVVKIALVEKQPPTSWNLSAPDEYGFFANVNPEVDHPRWSQARERRLGEFLRRKTMAFNGYGGEVSSMYAGMDLRKSF